ncbi:hypothetical protein [Endothiovibrio diazotrophicus]
MSNDVGALKRTVLDQSIHIPFSKHHGGREPLPAEPPPVRAEHDPADFDHFHSPTRQSR